MKEGVRSITSPFIHQTNCQQLPQSEYVIVLCYHIMVFPSNTGKLNQDRCRPPHHEWAAVKSNTTGMWFGHYDACNGRPDYCWWYYMLPWTEIDKCTSNTTDNWHNSWFCPSFYLHQRLRFFTAMDKITTADDSNQPAKDTENSAIKNSLTTKRAPRTLIASTIITMTSMLQLLVVIFENLDVSH